jgi:hypothetical protein
VLAVGPIGSRSDTLFLWKTPGGYVWCGCFRGTIVEFLSCVDNTHGDNEHGRAYRAVIHAFKAMGGANAAV